MLGIATEAAASRKFCFGYFKIWSFRKRDFRGEFTAASLKPLLVSARHRDGLNFRGAFTAASLKRLISFTRSPSE